MEIYLHKNFVTGITNSNNITDYQFFSGIEEARFNSLLKKLLFKNGVFCGANRRSDRTVHEGNKRLAKQYNIYHYHFVDDCIYDKCHFRNNCKEFIPGGPKTSSEVLHFLINSKDSSLVIFGYSRVHTDRNFPSLNTRPLIDRLNYASNLTLNTIEFINYINLSEILNIALSQKNLTFVNLILSVLSIDIENILKDSLEENLFKLFTKMLVDTCKQNATNIINLTRSELESLYKHINS